MSKVLKWILYVALGLVVLALIAGIFIAIFGGLGHGYYMMRPGFRMMEPTSLATTAQSAGYLAGCSAWAY
jgi:hypothetical protein